MGITFRLEASAQGERVNLRIKRLMSDIHLHKSDGIAVGRPPVGGAQVQLFGINPVELTIQESGRTVVSQPGDFAGGDFERVQIVFAPEGNEAPPGRELGVALGFSGCGKLVPFSGIDVKKEKIAGGDNQHFFAGISPGEDLFGDAGVLPLMSVGRGRLDSFSFEIGEIDQELAEAGGDVVEPKLFFVEPGEALAVRRPLDGLEAGDFSFSGDSVDGNGLFLGGGGDGQKGSARDGY